MCVKNKLKICVCVSYRKITTSRLDLVARHHLRRPYNIHFVVNKKYNWSFIVFLSILGVVYIFSLSHREMSKMRIPLFLIHSLISIFISIKALHAP